MSDYCTLTITADVTNTANADGDATDAAGNTENVIDSDTASVDDANPSVAIVKEFERTPSPQVTRLAGHSHLS